MSARIIHWKPNGARRYPQMGAAGPPALVRVNSRGISGAVTFSGQARNRLVNSGATGTIVRSAYANGGD